MTIYNSQEKKIVDCAFFFVQLLIYASSPYESAAISHCEQAVTAVSTTPDSVKCFPAGALERKEGSGALRFQATPGTYAGAVEGCGISDSLCGEKLAWYGSTHECNFESCRTMRIQLPTVVSRIWDVSSKH